MTIDEVVRQVRLDIGNEGFFSQERGIEYPPTGTLQEEVPSLRGDIKGEVYDIDGIYIKGALVEIVGAKPPLGVLTDADGQYSITNLTSGKICI